MKIQPPFLMIDGNTRIETIFLIVTALE